MGSLACCLEYLVSPYDPGPGIVSWGYHNLESLTTNLPLVDSLNLVVCLNDFEAAWNNCVKQCNCVANVQQQPFLFLPILWFSGKKFFPQNVGLIQFKCRKWLNFLIVEKAQKARGKQEFLNSHWPFVYIWPQMNTNDFFRWCWASAIE